MFGMTRLNAELKHVRLHLKQIVMILMKNVKHIWVMVHVQLHRMTWVVLLDLINAKE